MEAKIQYKNERNRVRSAKILEDVLIQFCADMVPQISNIVAIKNIFLIMEAKIQYKNERNRVRSAKILEDVLIQRRAELSIQKLSARL